ncbi:AAA family ATPase [Echinicola marina]|uniref:AAA family ATPase n=1 Tax=Echinicola marina TaxID=2859768 RepID=UPI001CF6977D|nr:AAA family ATPase [Echinicola marina]UCS92496.1 AAA family ATPase [Echinicola marina]
MIQQITKINGFGILDNLQAGQKIEPFNKYNLIYGWNGSGKTTLSRLLRCMEIKTMHAEFDSAEFTINLTEGKIESKKIDHTLDIRVFNQDFVSDNLNLFDAKTKPIIFISKEKVDEKKELDGKKSELKSKQGDIEKIDKEFVGLKRKIEDFHKAAGKSIKDFFLGTVYANVTYNKNTSEKIWNDLKREGRKLQDYELSEADLSQEKNYTLLNSKKDEISETQIPTKIEVEKLTQVQKEVNKLLTTNITSRVIERLKDNPEIGKWVEDGLVLYNKYESSNCEFCGQALPKSRIEDLEKHFSKEYTDLKDQITQMVEKLEKGIRLEITDQSYLLYESLKAKYILIMGETNKSLLDANGILRNWIDSLSAKKSDPFRTFDEENSDLLEFSKFNNTLADLIKVIKEHNEITRSHQQKAENAKKKIEYHFISQRAITDGLRDIEEKKETLGGQLGSEKEKSSLLADRISELENSLKSDTLAIEEINNSIHKFLGRNNIVLERQEEGGYQLKRGGIVARNLSEGEKTAISLIYFFSKIQENDAKLADQIIILDDPISSFDSNHLFNASSLIKKTTEKSKQLFVLTHNFWFFKQVRDWMHRKNSKEKSVSNVYLIKQGVIADANKSLVSFHSEYQHVFKTVLDFQDMDNIDESLCFTIANSIRRLLEAFTSFKCPDNSGFNGALQLGEKKGLPPEKKERIYYFVHKYSHLDRIESLDNTVEPLMEEGKNVVHDVLRLIKKVDEDHYKSMLRICSYEDKIED